MIFSNVGSTVHKNCKGAVKEHIVDAMIAVVFILQRHIYMSSDRVSCMLIYMSDNISYAEAATICVVDYVLTAHIC